LFAQVLGALAALPGFWDGPARGGVAAATATTVLAEVVAR
jgi:hypothetical protein